MTARLTTTSHSEPTLAADWLAAPTEHEFVAADGVRLFYRAWLPPEPARRALVLLHRGHEHSGRFADTVRALALPDVAVFAWDARGHGRSPGERGAAPGFACLVNDLDGFVGHLGEKHGIPPSDMVVLGHSIAAVTVAAWVHDYAPPIRAMALLTPALRVRLYVPLAIPGLRLLQKLRGQRGAFIKSYVKSSMLTHDVAEQQRYDADPLIARSIAVNVLLDLHDASTRLLDDAGAIRTPALVLTAGNSDWVVRLDAQQRFFERLGSPVKRLRVFDGMHHDILHETDRAEVIAAIREFVVEMFATPPADAPLLDADRQGYTKAEYDRLRAPLPALSPKRIAFAAQSAVMKTVGKLSNGIRLGWQTGFDSGPSLDYVYENRPRGRTLLGRLGDRSYLNAIGWRGIRQRKLNLQALLRAAIERQRAAGRPVHIVDIAAGCGRYVLQTAVEFPPGVIDSILLRDNTAENLDGCREIAERLQLCNVRYEQADAFDEASLAAIEPRPTVAIVSGLYELFPDNAPVLASLRGIARAMAPGGSLLYTGQPWHPQVEMIARVLVNRDKQPWIMRRRTQRELDDLVRAAGFDKVGMEIDRWGIFTVSHAVKEAE
jgi:alpha-beta hydrolase superfamily lysophospholipase